MSKNKIFTSAKKAVRKAYGRTVILYGSCGALATGCYLNAQRIVESYVPGGIWNAEAWQQNWSSGGSFAALSIGGAALFGLMTAIGFPIRFKGIYDMSNTQTELNEKGKKITQTKPTFFDKNGTYFPRKGDSFDYDVILSIKVNQGPLQRKDNTGDLEITAIRLDEAEEKKYEGDSKLVEKVFTIPYQEAPFDLRKKLSEDLSKHGAIKGKLRSTIPSL